MNRKNFAGVSGVILDVCKSHGTWFDQGELPRVLAFVAAGGLAHSKKREAEEQARAARAARVAAAELPSPASHRGPLFEGAASHGLAELLVDLLLR
jgi:Zn-finger nucleic acid-binding protein